MSQESNENDRQRLPSQIKRLRLAASDMEQVVEAAATLRGRRLSEGAERIMHTGIVIAYVRPFKNAGIGSLDEEVWGPADPGDRALHDRLVELRDKVYAHTDNTEYRDVQDTSALLGIEGGPTYAESWVSLSEGGVARISLLADAQARRFKEAAAECEFALGRTRPDDA
jgi:hypothetical protein